MPSATDAEHYAELMALTGGRQQTPTIEACVEANGRPEGRRKPKEGSWAHVLENLAPDIDTSNEFRRLFRIVRQKALPGLYNANYKQKARDFVFWCCQTRRPPANPRTATAALIGEYYTWYALYFKTSSLSGVSSALRAVARDHPAWTSWTDDQAAEIAKTVRILMAERGAMEKTRLRYPMDEQIREAIARSLDKSLLRDLQYGARDALMADGMMRTQDCARGKARQGDLRFHEAETIEGRTLHYYGMRVRKGKRPERHYYSPYTPSEGPLSAYHWCADYRRALYSRTGRREMPDDFLFPLITTLDDGSEVVDWTQPMDDAAFLAEVRSRALDCGVPQKFVTNITLYSWRSGGVAWRSRQGKSVSFIKRRGGWLGDSYKFYMRQTPAEEALAAETGEDALISGVPWIFAKHDACAVWSPLKEFPAAEEQDCLYVTRAVAGGRAERW